MSEDSNRNDANNRRDFLTGRQVREQIQRRGEEIADALVGPLGAPRGGSTLRLTTRAMACEFSVIMNPGEHRHVMNASTGLDLIHKIESQLTVYRQDSEVIRLNQTAAQQPVQVDSHLFELFQLSARLAIATDGAFDLTSGPLISLWRDCKLAHRIPDQTEIDQAKQLVGMQLLELDPERMSVFFRQSGVTVNFGAIGKGHALDRMASELRHLKMNDFLLHGGHSSILAEGDHNQTGGWPVGIGNPLFPERRLGTLILINQAMATSGSNIQYFRCQGQRYGHILDPRSGWPVDGTLSVTALAPSAAEADALSTAFYVMGTEKTRKYCQQFPEIGAIVIPFPKTGKRVHPELFGVNSGQVFWDQDQVGFAPIG